MVAAAPDLFDSPLGAGVPKHGMNLSGWGLVVNFLMPPPLVLTLLLILPTPLVVQKAVLRIVKNVLYLDIAGGSLKLVHVMLTISALAFSACCVTTYGHIHHHGHHALTANQLVAMRASKWRMERNFWIAALTFLLWGLLYRFYGLMQEHAALRERVQTLEANFVGAQTYGSAPSAPPLAGTTQSGKKAPSLLDAGSSIAAAAASVFGRTAVAGPKRTKAA